MAFGVRNGRDRRSEPDGLSHSTLQVFAGVEVEGFPRGSEQGALHLAAALEGRGVRCECRRTQPSRELCSLDHVCDPF